MGDRQPVTVTSSRWPWPASGYRSIMFDEFFGVPLHPLAVHAPVVLLPIAAVVSVVALSRTAWRDRLGWWLAGGVGALVVMLFVAKESGEEVKNQAYGVATIDRHEELGNQTFVITLVWFLVTVGVVARDRMVRGNDVEAMTIGPISLRRDAVSLTLSAIAAVGAVVATIWLIRTGHLGAEGRWS